MLTKNKQNEKIFIWAIFNTIGSRTKCGDCRWCRLILNWKIASNLPENRNGK